MEAMTTNRMSIMRSRIRRCIVISAVVALMICTWFITGGWFWNRLKAVESTEIIMNTSVSVKIFVKDTDRGEKLIQKAFAEARRVEKIMESVQGDGELRRLNKRGLESWVAISPELSMVIRESYGYFKISDGAFDPTIAPVKWLWDFDNGGSVPSADELQRNLSYVGFSNIEIRGDSLRYRKKGTQIDLGGVAKGYAVDRMIQVLCDGGVESILVNAGGDIATYGTKPGGVNWVIAIRHPRMPRNLLIKSNPLSAVATSGDYQRYFMEDGVRYHHILDPSDGFPARGCISVTAWAESAMEADMLATTIFVLGPEKGIALAESLDNVETFIFYEKDGRVESLMSSGLKDRIGF
jgi:FAD:protein FMN transferase